MDGCVSTGFLGIWLTGTNKMKGTVCLDAELVFRGLMAAHLKVEFTYYKMVSDLEGFVTIWGYGNVVCSVIQESLVLMFRR